MDENEFELNGVVYVAVEESIDGKQCNGCAMKNDGQLIRDTRLRPVI